MQVRTDAARQTLNCYDVHMMYLVDYPPRNKSPRMMHTGDARAFLCSLNPHAAPTRCHLDGTLARPRPTYYWSI